jgi:hypothetical protein
LDPAQGPLPSGQLIHVIHVLDRNTPVSVHEALVPRELPDHLGRADQTCSAQQHLARDDRRVKHNREILLEAAHGEAAAQEFGHPPMGKERDLQNTVDEIEFARACAEALFDRRRPVRERDEPDLKAGDLEPLHRREKRERPLILVELAANSEMGLVTREITPQHLAKIGIGRNLGPQGRQIERRPFRREHIVRYHDAAIGGDDAIGIDPTSGGPFGDHPCRKHDFGRAQHVIVERLQLVVTPEPPGIAPRQADDMRRPGCLRHQVRRHPVWLQIMRIDDVEPAFGVEAGGDRGELRDERARHRDVGLREIDGIGEVHRDRAVAIRRPAPLPVLRPHVHAIGWTYLLGVGHDMNVVTAHRKRVRCPVGAHADAALDGRKLADDTNSHSCTSTSPFPAGPSMRRCKPVIALSVAVQSSKTEGRPKAAGRRLDIRG